MSEPGYERSMGAKRLVTLVIQSYCKENESITLYRAIRTKTFNQDSTAEIFKEIAKTLQYIYSKGYLHNDLKSNNVLIDRVGMEEFRPIIIDFGKSKGIFKGEGHKRRVGASYLAPEVKLG